MQKPRIQSALNVAGCGLEVAERSEDGEKRGVGCVQDNTEVGICREGSEISGALYLAFSPTFVQGVEMGSVAGGALTARSNFG